MLEGMCWWREWKLAVGWMSKMWMLMLIIMSLDEEKNLIFIIFVFFYSHGKSNWDISEYFEHYNTATAPKIIIDTIYDIGCIDICAATCHDNINCHDNSNSRFIIIKFQFTASYDNNDYYDEKIETENFIANTTWTTAMSGKWNVIPPSRKLEEKNLKIQRWWRRRICDRK